MKVIWRKKESLVGSVFATALMVSLSLVTVWASLGNLWILPIAVLLIAMWLFFAYAIVEKLKRGESCVLGIENGAVVWIVTTKTSPTPSRHTVPLGSIRTLEVVFPKVRWEEDSKDYLFARVYLVDAHQNRHELPRVLGPGVYHKRIFDGIREDVPNLVLVERMETERDRE